MGESIKSGSTDLQQGIAMLKKRVSFLHERVASKRASAEEFEQYLSLLNLHGELHLHPELVAEALLAAIEFRSAKAQGISFEQLCPNLLAVSNGLQ